MTDTVVCRHSSYLLYIYPVPSCIASQSIDKSASFPLLYRSSCCAHVILDSLWSNDTSRLKCRAMNSYQRWHRLQTWLHLRFEIIEIHRSQCIYQCISVPILDVYKKKTSCGAWTFMQMLISYTQHKCMVSAKLLLSKNQRACHSPRPDSKVGVIQSHACCSGHHLSWSTFEPKKPLEHQSHGIDRLKKGTCGGVIWEFGREGCWTICCRFDDLNSEP